MGNQNPALTALSRVLDDAARRSGTSAKELMVQKLEFRPHTDGPTPIPPAFFITLGNGYEYEADTQGNITRLDDVKRELRVRFTRTGGIGGWTSTYEADESTLSVQDGDELRSLIGETDFFNLPNTVENGDPIPDLYSYAIWIAHGRHNHAISTYDGTGPLQSPELPKLIAWLNDRIPQFGPSISEHLS